MKKAYSAGMLDACKGAHTLFTGQRKRERERCIICTSSLFLFLKGMMGALAPFSYLVYYANVFVEKEN